MRHPGDGPPIRKRGRSLLLALLGLLSLSPPGAAQRAGAPRLGVDGLVLFRTQGSVAVLARATPFWQPVSTRSEELLGDFRYLPEYASARAQGQLFHLLHADDPQMVSAGDGQFAVVPWSFGPGCAEEGWAGSQWVTPGDTVAFLLHPTRTASTREGRPVFDVLGWHQPYPTGELIPFWRRGRSANPEWLTPVEFYHLLTVLPRETAFQLDPEGATAPFHAWLREDPDRARTFPIPEILEGWGERNPAPASGRGPG